MSKYYVTIERYIPEALLKGENNVKAREREWGKIVYKEYWVAALEDMVLSNFEVSSWMIYTESNFF